MTAIQVILRILSVPVLLGGVIFGLSYGATASASGSALAAGVALVASVGVIVGSVLLSLTLWWMGDIHGYLDDLTS